MSFQAPFYMMGTCGEGRGGDGKAVREEMESVSCVLGWWSFLHVRKSPLWKAESGKHQDQRASRSGIVYVLTHRQNTHIHLQKENKILRILGILIAVAP